jgi:non-canonical purine NTP pyrophosphatase (RdgB/HAM1 family)
MKDFTFITGNEKKAQYLSTLLGLPVRRVSAELDELQTTDIQKLIQHKAKQAYDIIKSPVLVEDQGLVFTALGGLPGPFIKFFVEDTGQEACCRMLDGFSDRSAVAESIFAYYDGEVLTTFTSSLKGAIAQSPKGEGGFGWDPIFIPEGYTKTRSELTEKEDHEVYLKIKPIAKVREFLTSNY